MSEKVIDHFDLLRVRILNYKEAAGKSWAMEIARSTGIDYRRIIDYSHGNIEPSYSTGKKIERFISDYFDKRR